VLRSSSTAAPASHNPLDGTTMIDWNITVAFAPPTREPIATVGRPHDAGLGDAPAPASDLARGPARDRAPTPASDPAPDATGSALAHSIPPPDARSHAGSLLAALAGALVAGGIALSPLGTAASLSLPARSGASSHLAAAARCAGNGIDQPPAPVLHPARIELAVVEGAQQTDDEPSGDAAATQETASPPAREQQTSAAAAAPNAEAPPRPATQRTARPKTQTTGDEAAPPAAAKSFDGDVVDPWSAPQRDLLVADQH
jgi:hypothetical protein